MSQSLMMPPLVTIVTLLLLVTRSASSPLQLQEADTTTYPPGPPEILSDLEAYDYEAYDEEEDGEDDLLYEDIRDRDIRVEIDAFVSRSPPAENSNETETEYEDIIQTLLEVKRTRGDSGGLGLQLSWWQILMLASACLLVTGLCCYFSSCCFLAADCCGDPYWGCCRCCMMMVSPLKPPPHLGLKSRGQRLDSGGQRPGESKYSLNENSTAPRTRASTRSLSVSHTRGSNKSVNNINESREEESGSRSRKYSRDRTRPLTSEEEERLLGDSLRPSVHTLSSGRDTLTSTSQQGNTLNSVKSVRNYKRTQQRPASTLNGDPLGAKRAGLCESEPHVYKDGTGSYFSWLHLFNRSKRRYNVSRRVKKPRAGNGTGHVSGPGNNNIYRQTRYQHIATGRNSAVIPTKISKRASTASAYNARPMLSKRSRSAETVDSVEDGMRPVLEAVVSERNIPRSRLSANLAQLEAARRMAREVGPEYNLKYFEKSLMKSKETTI